MQQSCKQGVLFAAMSDKSKFDLQTPLHAVRLRAGGQLENISSSNTSMLFEYVREYPTLVCIAMLKHVVRAQTTGDTDMSHAYVGT